jgi:hypothetical protein
MNYILHFTPKTFLIWQLDEFGFLQVALLQLENNHGFLTQG